MFYSVYIIKELKKKKNKLFSICLKLQFHLVNIIYQKYIKKKKGQKTLRSKGGANKICVFFKIKFNLCVSGY